VCTTWGVSGKNLFLLGLFRRRLEYPAFKRGVPALHDAVEAFRPFVLAVALEPFRLDQTTA